MLLLHHVGTGATGRLCAAGEADGPAVYLLHGQLMAAVHPQDEPQLVRLSHLRGGLTDGQADELRGELESGASIFGRMLDCVPGELFEQLLLDRFRQNLATFVGEPGRPTFEPLRTVMVDNLQMGHDTRKVIDEACVLYDQASSLPLTALVMRGERPPANKEERIVGVRLGFEPRAVGDLLSELPMEPLVARSVLHTMVEAGTAVISADSPDPAQDDDPEEHVELLDELDDEEEEDDNTEMVERSALGLPPPVPQPEPEVEFLEDPSFDLSDEVDIPASSTPGGEASPEAAQEDAFPEPEPEPEPVADAAGLADQGREEAVPNLSSLDAWLGTATTVDEDELEFFSDHDYDRGGADDGKFSTEQHNLDKVEVHDVAEDVLEADEAPTARFSAPVLSEDEALGKLNVANDVLTLVVRAFDEAEGTGRGRAVVQLLIDGSPARYAALVQDVQVEDDGRLPDVEVLHNLYGRPASEHRQLINQGLVDLIERALSSAADELPDEAFDAMLEQVAGYRQRLGL